MELTMAMEIPKQFNPHEAQKRWLNFWNRLRSSPWFWFVFVPVLLVAMFMTLVVYLLWAVGNT